MTLNTRGVAKKVTMAFDINIREEIGNEIKWIQIE